MSRNRGFGVIGGGGGGGGGVTRNGNDFVYQPGGTAGGNVYTTQATLNAAVAAARGARRILIDTTQGAAVWDTTMDFGTEQGPVEVLGTKSVAATTELTFENGANLRGPFIFTDLDINVNNTDAPVCDGPSANILTYSFRGDTTIACNGSQPFIKPTRIAGGRMYIELRDRAMFLNGGNPIVEMPNGYGAYVDVHDQATLAANTVKGSNQGNYVRRHGSYATASATQPGGSVWNYQELTATGTSYDAGLVAEGINAGSVQGAVDYLKQQVWRAYDYVNVDGAAALDGVARTVGAQIRVNRVREALGIKFAWHKAVSGIATARLRDAGGTVIASAAVDPVDAASVYYAEFAAPVDLTPYMGQVLSVSVYDGADAWGAPNATHPAQPNAADAAVTILGYVYAAGNANPTTAAGATVYGVDLVTRGPS